ncbi:MAG: CRISPR-associated helicase Cas3' [Thiotrichales bacterium]
MDYDAFFSLATGGQSCYAYQRRLAEQAWPELLEVPTGLGKTAAITLAWLWKRGVRARGERGMPDTATPCRMVWCLPMRVLAEQTVEAVSASLERLDWLGTAGQGRVSVHLLIGGEDGADAWVEHPEEEMVLIGTQDMLLSRALMRGYGMSRYAWPVHYAFLHNDCLWVYDEVQLMGPGLATSAQLEAFRRTQAISRHSRSLWVSATLQPEWLATVDFRPHLATAATFRLSDAEAASEAVKARRAAIKRLARAQTVLDDVSAKAGAKAYAEALAEEVARCHVAGMQSVVIVNTVERAQAVFQVLGKRAPSIPLLLVHSRFRPIERRALNQALRDLPSEGRIVIATQAIEAGVDITSRTLFTELAPWSSLVQRFGRCNRYGEAGADGADLYWIDLANTQGAPYAADALDAARGVLSAQHSAAPADLPPVTTDAALVPVIRRRDFLDLFNTEPDLTGFDVDVSPYIRDADEADVLMFWRELPRDSYGDADPRDQSAPARDELCRAGVGGARTFLKGKDAFVWEGLTRQWRKLDAQRIHPGLTVLLDAKVGGYDPRLGYLASSKSAVTPVPSALSDAVEAMDDDRWSQLGRAVELSRHSCDVEDEALALCLRLDESAARVPLARAARWHDVGKAHRAFQSMLLFHDADAARREGTLWAKSAARGRAIYATCGGNAGYTERKHFRHELASALAWLDCHDGEPDADLVAYLIAAHHGKVRLAIRSLPGETEPPATTTLFARGIWAGDHLPAVEIEGRESIPATTMGLDLMQLGRGAMGESWAARTQTLLAEHGPFRLAWLEALLRVADWRASRREQLGES